MTVKWEQGGSEKQYIDFPFSSVEAGRKDMETAYSDDDDDQDQNTAKIVNSSIKWNDLGKREESGWEQSRKKISDRILFPLSLSRQKAL